MQTLLTLILLAVAIYLLMQWYNREVVHEGEGTVRLQSEHEHFHLHVDMPRGLQIEPGDTVEILTMPEIPYSQTQGEVTYSSRIRLYRASWLRRNLVKASSIVEVKELVEHP